MSVKEDDGGLCALCLPGLRRERTGSRVYRRTLTVPGHKPVIGYAWVCASCAAGLGERAERTHRDGTTDLLEFWYDVAAPVRVAVVQLEMGL